MTAADRAAYYRPHIEAAARHAALAPALVEAVVAQESDYRTHAYRYEPAFWRRYLAGDDEYRGTCPERVAASYGLMQVMFPTAVQHDVLRVTDAPEALFAPEMGLRAGCAVLQALTRWAEGEGHSGGDLALRRILGAYNGGRGNWGGAVPQAYASQVIARYDAITRLRTAPGGPLHA